MPSVAQGSSLAKQTASSAFSVRDDRLAEAACSDEVTAQALGILAVPCFVLGGRYGVSGAQLHSLTGSGWGAAEERSLRGCLRIAHAPYRLLRAITEQKSAAFKAVYGSRVGCTADGS